MHPNFSARVVDAARTALHSPSPIVYFIGTDEEDKGRAAAGAFLAMASLNPGNYLLRIHHLRFSLADLTFGRGLAELLGSSRLKRLEKDRRIKVGESTLYLDSVSPASQRHTPYHLKAVYRIPFNAGEKKRGMEDIRQLQKHGAEKLFLATCIDEAGDSWLERYQPEIVLLDDLDESSRHSMLGPSYKSDFRT